MMVVIIYLLYYYAATAIPFQIIDQVLAEIFNISLYAHNHCTLKMSCCRGNRKTADINKIHFYCLAKYDQELIMKEGRLSFLMNSWYDIRKGSIKFVEHMMIELCIIRR